MSAVPNPIQPAAPSSPQPAPLQPVPGPEEPKKGGPWKGLSILAVLGVLGYLGYQWLAKPTTDTTVFAAVKTATVAAGSLERVIRVAGSTSAREFANVTAPILRGPEARNSLYLTKLVKPGSIVRKGDVIAQIDGQWLLDHMEDVRDDVRQAENDVLKRRAEQAVETEQLQQTLRVAKSTWDKAKLEFGAAEVRSDVERELLKLSMEEAEARYKQQLADVNQKKAAHAAELKILELTAERHRRHLGRHDNDLKRYTIISPIDGLAVMQTLFRGGEMVQISEGDQVAPGQPFMKVINQRTMQEQPSDGGIDFPGGGDVAAILVAVGIADHHFLQIALRPHHRARQRRGEIGVHHDGGVAQILHRLEQRHHAQADLGNIARQEQTGLLHQQCGFEQVGGTGRLGNHILRHRAFAETGLQRGGLVGDRQLPRGLR